MIRLPDTQVRLVPRLKLSRTFTSLTFALSLAAVLAAAPPALATFPGASGNIAYNVTGIWTVSPGGGSPKQLTTASAPNNDLQPDFSPTGRLLAFARHVGSTGPTQQSQIWLMNQDGTNQHNISNDAFYDGNPSWSPDGKQIAFNRQVLGNPGQSQIWVMNADGSDKRDISDNQSIDADPQWSPDGRTILFVRQLAVRGSVSGGQIWAMNANGSGQHALTSNDTATLAYGTPNWSPDGTQIAFTYNVNNTSGEEQIWLMNANGSNQHELVGSTVDDFGPAWSPDGTMIVYSGQNGLHLIGANGSGDRQLTSDQGFRPDWQPLNADLAVTDTASTAHTSVRDKFSYTLRIQNNGLAPANGLQVTDALPRGVHLISTSRDGSCKRGRTVDCSLGVLASGASTSVTIKVKARRPTTASDTATASSATPDPDLADNSATATTMISAPKLRLSPPTARGHRVIVFVRCKAPHGTTCSGKARLVVRRRHGTVVVGHARYHVRSGSPKKLTIKLSRRGHDLLVRLGELHVRVLASVVDGRPARSAVVTLSAAAH